MERLLEYKVTVRKDTNKATYEETFNDPADAVLAILDSVGRYTLEDIREAIVQDENGKYELIRRVLLGLE